MNTLTFDIETEPNPKLVELFTSKIKAPKTYKDADKIKAYIDEKKDDLVKQMSVDVDFCQIKCIGIKIDDNPAEIASLGEFISILAEYTKVKAETGSEYRERALNFRIVGFNSKKFDSKVIIRHLIRQTATDGLVGAKKGVVKWLQDSTKRFTTDKQIDLMEVLGDREFKSLDIYSQIYLGAEKKEIDFEKCSLLELEEHCLEDVELTHKLYEKFKELI
jgi:phage terminase small subunit